MQQQQPQIPQDLTLDFAPEEVEAEALRLAMVRDIMQFKGYTGYDVLARENPQLMYQRLCSEAKGCFSPNAAAHECVGATDAYWKLKDIERKLKHRKLMSPDTHDRIGRAEMEMERVHLNATSKLRCKLRRFTERAEFTDIRTGRKHLASGTVYICESTGAIHHCTIERCRRRMVTPHGENVFCELTERDFGVPITDHQEQPMSRDGEGRDGGMSFTSGAAPRGGGGGGGRKRSTYGTSNATHLLLDDGTHRRRRSNVSASSIAAENYRYAVLPWYIVTSPSLGRASQNRKSLLRETMEAQFPDVKRPMQTNELRAHVFGVCAALLYAKGVRAMLWQRLREAHASVVNSIREASQQRAGSHTLLLSAVVALDHAVRPHYDQLARMGPFDQQVDQDVVEYFSELVFALWELLHYTPFAARFSGGVPLKKHAGGFLYVLQSGFSVDRPGGDRMQLVPRYRYLDCLPRKADLNQVEVVAELRSANVIETENFVSACFRSLLESDHARIDLFAIARYISTRE